VSTGSLEKQTSDLLFITHVRKRTSSILPANTLFYYTYLFNYAVSIATIKMALNQIA
jgi:hypothetical protein